ncbi:ferritin-like domain-containing protein [Sporobolomyces salmoneus]|uniref:ferritin-like domain-containing protein n=1 Tax=Sporobolomyces salmoneus TaxID=183962 RepID=UPI00316E6044
MRSTIALLALGAASVSAAVVPAKGDIQQMKRNIIARQNKNLIKRNSVTTGADDATILQFALILEHLEDTFYSEALEKFDNATFTEAGYPGVYAVLQQVAKDEHAHVEFLTAGLKAAGVENPPQACTYNFPYTDVQSFLGLSQVVEGLGVSAYLGAAGDIDNADYVTAAGSILTVEARHNAFIRLLNNYDIATPFDTPLSASAVVGAASALFKECPEGSAPSIQAPPALTLNTTSYELGSQITVAPANASAVNTNQQLYCGFASGLASAFSEWSNNQCTIPSQNLTGAAQTYLLLTTGPSLDDKSVVAGPVVLELGTPNITVLSSNTSRSTSGSAGASAGSNASATNAAGSIKTGGLAVAGGLFAGALSLLF